MTSNGDTGEIGFGYDPIEQSDSFVLLIPRDEEAPVRLLDHRGAEMRTAEEVEEYAAIPQCHWNLVESRLRVYFNQRLKSANLLPGVWRFGENRLSEEFGKELAVLLWSLEPVPTEQVSRVYANWRKLTPHERRWLYDRIATAPPQADPEVGWRRAVQIALLEEPDPASLQQRAPIAAEQGSAILPTARESASTRKRKNLERAGQLRLL